MTIKEVEKLVDLKKANIRYYEEEGLLSPKRNLQNNYREYGMEDVEVLKKIKLLRLLGIPVSEIRKYQKEEISLANMMQQRMNSLEKEAGEIQRLKEMCAQMNQSHKSFEDIDVSLFDVRNSFFLRRGERIMKMDKIFQLERYYKMLTRVWQILLLIYMPLFLALKYTIHVELPSWLTIPVITAVYFAAIMSGIIQYRIMHYKEDTL